MQPKNASNCDFTKEFVQLSSLGCTFKLPASLVFSARASLLRLSGKPLHLAQFGKEQRAFKLTQFLARVLHSAMRRLWNVFQFGFRGAFLVHNSCLNLAPSVPPSIQVFTCLANKLQVGRAVPSAPRRRTLPRFA